MKRTIYILMIAAMGTVGGCGKKEQPADVPVPLEQKATKGPVSMVVTTDCSKAKVAQPVTLTAEVTADNGVTVTFPAAPKKFGDMRVVSCTDSPDIPVDNAAKRLWKRTLVLDSFTPGDKKIPGVKIDFEDNRDKSKPIKTSLETEPMTLKIETVIQGKADPYKPRDIKGTVELTPRPDYTWIWYILGGLVAAVVVFFAVRYFIRRKLMRALTAGEWAMRQLNTLEGEHLPEAGKVERFYVRLTGIVRQYVERRFMIAAPKLTTREFLDEVQQRHSFDDDKRASLQDFLTAADMVKFAQFQPTGGEIDSSMSMARQFVEQTAARSEKDVRA